MLILISKFHTSAQLLALRTHRLFPKIDWERVEAGNYAVVDPINPGVILYLSEQDYIVMVRVAITSNRTLKVLASSGETALETPSTPDSTSQNSPNLTANKSVPFAEGIVFSGTARRRLQTMFSSLLDRFLHKERKVVKGSKIATIEKTSMIKLTGRNVRHWFNQWYNLVSWYSRGSIITTVAMTERNSFGLNLARILRTRGIVQVIARFKIFLFVINSYLGGRKLTTTQELGQRVKLVNGLPQAIPTFARHGLRVFNKHYIHIWTSMCFAYKGILGLWVEPNLEISSITQGHPDFSGNNDFKTFQQDFCSVFWYNIIVPLGIRPPDLTIKNAFFTTHAGPNSPISLLGAGLDAFLWFAAADEETYNINKFEVEALIPELSKIPTVALKLTHVREWIGVPRNLIREWLEATSQLDLLKQFRMTAKMFKLSYLLTSQIVPHFEEESSRAHKTGQPIMMTKVCSAILGLNLRTLRTRLVLQRLHNLYEAAGKVRTIAIVDYWTNFVLKPLHDWMFEILKALPQDATFDQEGKVREFASRGYMEIWSLDLKSATDLIPLALYRALMYWVLPVRIVDLWIELLVNRDFATPTEMRRTYPDASKQIRYNTGQPMGALTSWASMALVHHALVLFAAMNCGETRRSSIISFTEYLVLGDDVVIANKRVAEEYMRLCRSLSIPIGLAKSYISECGMFNFANQSFVGDSNISPISMKEEAQITSLPGRAELALRMVRRGWRGLRSRGWLSSILKLFLNEKSFNRTVRPIMISRGINPTIAWVLSSLLSPGTTRLGFAGFGSLPLETLFGAIARKGALWSTRIEDYVQHVTAERQNALIAVLAQWVNTVYSDFLRNRKRLEVFDEWVSQIISPDIEWLLRRIFQEARKEAFVRWTSEYRMPLKEIQVSTRLPNFNIYDVEAGTGRTWADVCRILCEAEAALPQVPDFLSHTIEVLTALVGGVGNQHQQAAALRAFMRLTNIIGMVDHIGSFVTPGIILPEANTSLEESIALLKEENSGPSVDNHYGGLSNEKRQEG